MWEAVKQAFQAGTQRPVHGSHLLLSRDASQASSLQTAAEGRGRTERQEDIPSQVPIVTLTVQADSPGSVRRAKASSKAMHAVP